MGSVAKLAAVLSAGIGELFLGAQMGALEGAGRYKARLDICGLNHRHIRQR
jgi:hypothetical protein